MYRTLDGADDKLSIRIVNDALAELDAKASARGAERSFSYLPWDGVASSAGVEYTTGFSSSSSYAPLSRASL